MANVLLRSDVRQEDGMTAGGDGSIDDDDVGEMLYNDCNCL